MHRTAAFFVLAALWCASAFAQANGKLQIHFIDVGQGDAALLISPQGETVLFDNGVLNQCGKPVAYLQGLGVSKIDYHIASHYHSDHVGCAATVLGMFPLQKAAYDRGGSYTTATYTAYVNAVGSKRATAIKGQTITLDAASASPVTITFAALNGNGINTTDENDLSLVSVVRFGQFDAVFGGDLSGSGTGTVDHDPADSPNPPSPSCTYSVSPTSSSVTSAGGSFNVSVTTSAGCGWTTTSNASWLSRSPSSGSGSGTVSVSASGNSGGARTGSVTVAGQTVTVSQSGTSSPPPTCCRVCTTGKPCGNSCIASNLTCHQPPGCACSTGSYTAVPWLNYTPSQPPAAYADIESTVGNLVGKVEVYKVHHHGSKFSSNASWLAATTPKVGIISVSNGNGYGHPTVEAVTRLHNVGTRTYWTSVGNGTHPTSGQDFVAGNVVVNVTPGATSFTVTYGSTTDLYSDWGFAVPGEGLPPAPPFGSVDTPSAGAVVTGEVGITGWALDNSGVTGVDIYRSALPGEPVQANGLVFLGTATMVAGARPDVASAYTAYPESSRAGWGYMLLSNMLPNQGNGTFTVSAYVRAMDGANTLLGSKTITLANATNTRPFGTIDTPAQGQTVSGTINNFGWALTPNPSSIPIDGSTIDVYVDNVLVGHPSYGHFRGDIAGLFPGYANSNGAIGFFTLDTTTLTNGVHTIAWVVRDNAGNASGIGSRYFTVSNPTAGQWTESTR
jgi:beta-lactamase superfamily II metal-dependent hydrolase